MGYEERFNQHIEEWINHCNTPKVRLSAKFFLEALDCEAYKNIVSMGPSILPFIRKMYNRSAGIHDLPPDKFLKTIEEIEQKGLSLKLSDYELSLALVKDCLTNLVIEIVGDNFKVPEDIIYDPYLRGEYTKRWLEENTTG
ncbi:hypothetical protein HY498_04185 [Candidatus Woesearchaeota archaeon]|nr:hypothetical protein [Candidatus Woesearchaeota archaeon]